MAIILAAILFLATLGFWFVTWVATSENPRPAVRLVPHRILLAGTLGALLLAATHYIGW
jgi:hypothetical protein